MEEYFFKKLQIYCRSTGKKETDELLSGFIESPFFKKQLTTRLLEEVKKNPHLLKNIIEKSNDLLFLQLKKYIETNSLKQKVQTNKV